MLRDPALAFIQAARRDLRIDLFVVFTWRSAATQLALFHQGREFRREEGVWTVVGPTVTNAQPDETPHTLVSLETHLPASCAFDVVPYANGTLLWDTPRSTWQQLWTLAWRFGFDPLGDTVGAFLKNDLGHFEEPGWRYKIAGAHIGWPADARPRQEEDHV